MVSTTALSNLIENDKEQREFVENHYWFLNKHGLIVSFIAHQFRFSDYYHVCHDIENFAISKYKERETALIKDKLQDILEALYPKFFTLYTSCYKNHSHSDIDQEIRFMKLLVGDISGLEKTVVSSKMALNLPLAQNSYDKSEFILANLQTTNTPIEFKNKGIFSPNQLLQINTNRLILNNLDASFNLTKASTFSQQSAILLEQGTLLNELLLYKQAIEVLTQAIQLNSCNRDAYVERAMAYFETNQLSLALQDYELAKKFTIIPPFKLCNYKALHMGPIYIPEHKTEFSKGLVSGTVEGAKVSTVEFIPSIFSSCRGILNGLWAFVCSPIEVSQEMIRMAYAVGEFISNHSAEECFQCVVPELKELSLTWGTLNDHSKGQKIGFIIGKYGIDIFVPVGALKGINKVRALKRANAMLTLENCALSQTKQAKILGESIKRASLREKIIYDAVTHGKILIRNSNTQVHIMQPAWDKLIKVSGNIEEDCRKMIKLLEDKKIF